MKAAQHFTNFLLWISFFLVLSACSESINNANQQTSLTSVATINEAEKCSEENAGNMVYVTTAATYFFCDANEWVPLHKFDTTKKPMPDTLFILKQDTIYSSNVDTLVISKKDSIYIIKYDSIFISKTDTLYIEKEHGTGILDFNPSSEIQPIMENLTHQKRAGNYELQAKQVVLLHFTDIHGDGENLKRIKEFKDAYSDYIDEVVHTGDAVYENWSDPTDFWSQAGAENFLNTLGNHDVYYKYGLSETQRSPQKSCIIVSLPLTSPIGILCSQKMPPKNFLCTTTKILSKAVVPSLPR